MSAQALPVRMGRSYGSWRYLVIAAIVATVLAIALVVANAGSTGSTGGSTTDTGPAKTIQVGGDGPARSAKTIQVGGDGPARFHLLPS